jgi:hypothetical protein
MDGLGPAAQFPIIYYTIARFQVYLKKIKKKETLFINLKKKNGSSKNVQEVKVHPSQASARGASPREVQNLLSRLSTSRRKITKEKVVDC